MELEKVVSSSTFERVIEHSDAQQRAQSLYAEEFKEHSAEHCSSKVHPSTIIALRPSQSERWS